MSTVVVILRATDFSNCSTDLDMSIDAILCKQSISYLIFSHKDYMYKYSYVAFYVKDAKIMSL